MMRKKPDPFGNNITNRFLKNGNELFLIWKELGMGFFLYEWRSHEYRKNNFPMNGLAGIVKENFPMSGEAANGETFFYYDC